MNDNKEIHLPSGLIFLLFYQGILVLVSLGPLAAWLEMGPWPFLLLVAFGIAMFFASVGMAQLRPRGFILGITCHLLLAIPAFLAVSYSILWGLQLLIQEAGFGGWATFAFSLGLMWLPILLISGWACFYLCQFLKPAFPR